MHPPPSSQGLGDVPCCCGCKCGGWPITRRLCTDCLLPYVVGLSLLAALLAAAGPAGPWLVLERWPPFAANSTAGGGAPNSTALASNSSSAYEQRHYLSGRVDIGPLCITPSSPRPPSISRSATWPGSREADTTTCFPLPEPAPIVLDVGALIPRAYVEDGTVAAFALIVVGVLAVLSSVAAVLPLVEIGPLRRKAFQLMREAHGATLWASSAALCVLGICVLFGSLARYNEGVTDPVRTAVEHSGSEGEWEAYARGEGRAAWPATLREELAGLVVRQGSGYDTTAAGASLLLFAWLLLLVVGCLGKGWLLTRRPWGGVRVSGGDGEAGSVGG